MANICTNILWISGIRNEKEMGRFMEKMADSFECHYVDESGPYCEIGFNSRNGFPDKEMDEIALNMENPDIQIGVISYDFSVNYVAYHLYKNGVWSKAL